MAVVVPVVVIPVVVVPVAPVVVPVVTEREARPVDVVARFGRRHTRTQSGGPEADGGNDRRVDQCPGESHPQLLAGVARAPSGPHLFDA
ncbi:hypothetical protein DVS77_06670 [Mycolicibacterium moriokaense]|nr:hypothetical protein DVS77_06670 [Mycolicibacterium moriokaense]